MCVRVGRYSNKVIEYFAIDVYLDCSRSFAQLDCECESYHSSGSAVMLLDIASGELSVHGWRGW